jgi:transposase
MIDSLPDNVQSLPETVEALRALVLATFAERDIVVTERDTLLTQNDRLRHLLLKLTRMHFGTKSERLPEEQLQLGLEALEQAIAKDEAEAEKQLATCSMRDRGDHGVEDDGGGSARLRSDHH